MLLCNNFYFYVVKVLGYKLKIINRHIVLW